MTTLATRLRKRGYDHDQAERWHRRSLRLRFMTSDFFWGFDATPSEIERRLVHAGYPGEEQKKSLETRYGSWK